MYEGLQFGFHMLEGDKPHCPRTISSLLNFNTVEVSGLIFSYDLVLEQLPDNSVECRQNVMSEECRLVVWTQTTGSKIIWQQTTCTKAANATSASSVHSFTISPLATLVTAATNTSRPPTSTTSRSPATTTAASSSIIGDRRQVLKNLTNF